MRIIRSVRSMQRQTGNWRNSNVRIGFVPTMGCLHAGHLSLVRRARQAVGPGGRIVVSIFVNPTQFGPGEDFANYPRDLARDATLCREAGVDAIFAPAVQEIYPSEEDGAFSTCVVEGTLSQEMEGASRPSHFQGVTTVVAKLFHIVMPEVAVFGQKDYQQAAIVRRMIRDLNFPVDLIVAPTIREPDGLAMSSRNQYLSAEERAQAPVLWQAIQLARKLVRGTGTPLPVRAVRKPLERLVSSRPAARTDYISFFDGRTLKPVNMVARGTHLALAVFVGRTRLIDNGRL